MRQLLTVQWLLFQLLPSCLTKLLHHEVVFKVLNKLLVLTHEIFINVRIRLITNETERERERDDM